MSLQNAPTCGRVRRFSGRYVDLLWYGSQTAHSDLSATKWTEKIHDVRVYLEQENGNTYAELEGSVALRTEDVEEFLDGLGDLVRRYQID